MFFSYLVDLLCLDGALLFIFALYITKNKNHIVKLNTVASISLFILYMLFCTGGVKPLVLLTWIFILMSVTLISGIWVVFGKFSLDDESIFY